MRGELPTIAARSQPASALAGLRSALRSMVSDCDFQIVVALSTIGVLAALNAMLWFPEFGEKIALLEIFP